MLRVKEIPSSETTMNREYCEEIISCGFCIEGEGRRRVVGVWRRYRARRFLRQSTQRSVPPSVPLPSGASRLSLQRWMEPPAEMESLSGGRACVCVSVHMCLCICI